MVVPNRIFDIHTHILPGIDDGAKTLTDSVAIVKWLADQGVTDIIATPHFLNESEYTSSREANLKLLEKLQNKLKREQVNVKIYLGNEIYIDDDIIRLHEEGLVSTLADSKYLLVELPLDSEFPNYDGYLRDLIDAGYRVILAHPERYQIVKKDFGVLKDLAKMGILFQSNWGSLMGKYGKEAEKIVKMLAKRKMIFALGSDSHHPGRSDYLTIVRGKLRSYYNEREISQLLRINPEKIITNDLHL